MSHHTPSTPVLVSRASRRHRSECLESLRRDWLHATDAYEEVTSVPFGQWVLPTAHRKAVSDLLEFPAPLFWNVAIA